MWILLEAKLTISKRLKDRKRINKKIKTEVQLNWKIEKQEKINRQKRRQNDRKKVMVQRKLQGMILAGTCVGLLRFDWKMEGLRCEQGINSQSQL